jgi:hypothetical protein
MKKYHKLIIGYLICLSLAGISYFWATNLMQSLYNYRSPFSKTPPTPGESTEPSITSKVVIILIDALRADTAYNSEVMPFINKMKEESAWGIMHSQTPSYSEPGWTTLLTGAWPEISDGPAMNLDYENIYPFTQDNIFSAAHRYGLKSAISGYYWFEKLLPIGSVDKGFYTEGEDDQADQEVVSAAIPWLTDDDINLILIHIDQVDYAGHHQGGPQSDHWDEAATRADALVKTIFSKLDLKQDTILILSDHGQIDQGGHGGQETIVLTEPYIFAGKGIIPGNYPDIEMVDIAPTISVLLGLNIPATNQGQPLLDILNINSVKNSLISIAFSNQQKQLLISYSNAIDPKNAFPTEEIDGVSAQDSILFTRNTRLKSETLSRSLIVTILLGVILILFLRTQKKIRIFPYLLTGFVFVLIFNFRYYVFDQHPYSLSWVTSQNDLIAYISSTTIISFFICWLLFIIFSKAYFKSVQEISHVTLKLTISTIFLVAVPIYISYVINGPSISWTLPDLISMYLAFLALLQCVFIAISGCILTLFAIPIHIGARKYYGVNLNEN